MPIDKKKWAVRTGQSLGIVAIAGIIGWFFGGVQTAFVAMIAIVILGIVGALIT
jgi:Ca2+-dependent lipid-binding protein